MSRGAYPFPDESAHVYQIWCQSVQPFDSFPRVFNLWPHKPPLPHAPRVLRGELYLAYVHSQMNPQTWTKVGANLTASQTFECVTPPPNHPPKMPRGIERRIVFSRCPFPDESADMYQIWCQSVQPFDSLPRLFEGRLLFSLCPFPDEFTDVNQSCCQSDIFPRLLNCWPPKPPSAPFCL